MKATGRGTEKWQTKTRQRTSPSPQLRMAIGLDFWYTDARFAGKNVPDRRYVKEQTGKDSQ